MEDVNRGPVFANSPSLNKLRDHIAKLHVTRGIFACPCNGADCNAPTSSLTVTVSKHNMIGYCPDCESIQALLIHNPACLTQLENAGALNYGSSIKVVFPDDDQGNGHIYTSRSPSQYPEFVALDVPASMVHSIVKR
jgi:hypothetical protein